MVVYQLWVDSDYPGFQDVNGFDLHYSLLGNLLSSANKIRSKWKVINYRPETLDNFHDSTVRTKAQTKNLYGRGLPDLARGLDYLYSARAVNALRALFEPFGEFLDVAIEGTVGKYFVFHCTNLSVAFEPERSGAEFSSQHVLSYVEQYMFDKRKLTDPEVFRLAVSPIRDWTFVTDSIFDAINTIGLTGFRLEEVWRSDQRRSAGRKKKPVRKPTRKK